MIIKSNIKENELDGRGVSRLNYIDFRTLRVNPKVDINTRLKSVSRETSTSRFTLRSSKMTVVRQSHSNSAFISFGLFENLGIC